MILDEVEQLLKNKFGECACIGTDDSMMIYITDESNTGKVRDYISAKTGIHLGAFSVKCIDSIPKNTFGKIMYSKLVCQ